MRGQKGSDLLLSRRKLTLRQMDRKLSPHGAGKAEDADAMGDSTMSVRGGELVPLLKAGTLGNRKWTVHTLGWGHKGGAMQRPWVPPPPPVRVETRGFPLWKRYWALRRSQGATTGCAR